MTGHNHGEARIAITTGATALGIELGSTRIKAVLTGPDHAVLATGGHNWENQLVDGRWTYSLDAVRAGLQDCFASLAADVHERSGVKLEAIGALGISAMMHGYLAFDAAGELLVPFRTWRNTSTARAADELSRELDRNIPQRWSVAHLYQAILDSEEHVGRVARLTTLAGYVHHLLTGEHLLGVGDASGMFPIDPSTRTYDAALLDRFDRLVAARELDWSHLADLLPEVRVAGEHAGQLTAEGAALLDPTGTLRPGAPCCPPEGDAGTGMVATNSIAPRTGNVSAGTSIFAMVVLDRELECAHPEIDLVATPAGDPVAMVHCNNGASEIDAWAGMFCELARRVGAGVSRPAVFDALFLASLDAEPDAGGMLAFNYLSGEPIAGLANGRPLVVRSPDSRPTLANFMRAQLFTTLATLRMGMDVLLREEGAGLDELFAHGGLFKTPGVAQRYLAAALDTSVSTGDIAGEGGAWGIAILAAYARDGGASLTGYLRDAVFAGVELQTIQPDATDVEGFNRYALRFRGALPVERAAAEHS